MVISSRKFFKADRYRYVVPIFEICRSIGFFTHSETPYDDLRIVHGSTINVDSLDTPDCVNFFETVGSVVLSGKNGGHIDIFAPVASCGEKF